MIEEKINDDYGVNDRNQRNPLSNNKASTMSTPRWHPRLMLPMKFLESKILKHWSDMVRFALYTTFFVLGISLGISNYQEHTIVYNYMTSGSTYTNIMAGNAKYDFSDGRIFHFSLGTTVDASRSIGFSQNGKRYCVAPLLESETADAMSRSDKNSNNISDSQFQKPPLLLSEQNLNSYSIWASGFDCCSPKGEFWCTAEHNYNLDISESTLVQGTTGENLDEDTLSRSRSFWGNYDQRGAGRSGFAVSAALDESQELGLRQAVQAASRVYDIAEPDWQELKLVYLTEDPASLLSSIRKNRTSFSFWSCFWFLPLAIIVAFLPGAGFLQKPAVETRAVYGYGDQNNGNQGGVSGNRDALGQTLMSTGYAAYSL